MMIKSRLRGGSVLIVCFFLTSTALLVMSPAVFAGQTADETIEKPASEKQDGTSEEDPYEDFNRSMFRFNSYLDKYLAKPISDSYLWVTPGFVKTGINNFFGNLKDISVILNDHMQGKFEQGAEDTGRFLANSTLGILGLFDVASDVGLQKHQEDFGQTLAVWGVPQGSYLVLPIMGPTTARGFPGSLVDVAANPATYVGVPVNLVSMLNTRANADGALKFIDQAAIDPYVFTREAYLQYQQNLITDGKGSSQVLPLEAELANDLDAALNEDEKKSASASSKESLSEGKRLSDHALDDAVVAHENVPEAQRPVDQSEEISPKMKKKHAKKHHIEISK